MTKEELRAQAKRGEDFIKRTSSEMRASEMQIIHDISKIDMLDALATAFYMGVDAGRRETEKKQRA